MRVNFVGLICYGSFYFPDVNVVLTVGGSIIGTIVNVIVPVMFYNRAYPGDLKHLKKDKGSKEEEEESLIDSEKQSELLISDTELDNENY